VYVCVCRTLGVKVHRKLCTSDIRDRCNNDDITISEMFHEARRYDTKMYRYDIIDFKSQTGKRMLFDVYDIFKTHDEWRTVDSTALCAFTSLYSSDGVKWNIISD